MERYVFVGEERSELARTKGWRWEDGRLAAKQLFDALRVNGIEPTDQVYVNIFEGDEIPEGTVVGMGRRVQAELDKRGIEHKSIIHPAARGKIRNKELYAKHIGEQLKKTK